MISQPGGGVIATSSPAMVHGRRVVQRLEGQPRVSVVSDEVDDGEHLAVGVESQAAPQLLNEDGRGLRGTQEQDAVDRRNIDALVEYVGHDQPL